MARGTRDFLAPPVGTRSHTHRCGPFHGPFLPQAICAPSHAKQERLVVDFKTKKQQQTDRIVATLERLYDGERVARPWLAGPDDGSQTMTDKRSPDDDDQDENHQGHHDRP